MGARAARLLGGNAAGSMIRMVRFANRSYDDGVGSMVCLAQDLGAQAAHLHAFSGEIWERG
jgi:hypothetical protein